MTDREPDDLYDALRDRLADYGQEPPAPLWATIRAQLPPPVAAPQLRPRRRRWSPVLLLGLLVAVVGAASWQWWHTGGARQQARYIAATATGETVAGPASQTGQSNHRAAGYKPSLPTGNQSAAGGLTVAKTSSIGAKTPSDAALAVIIRGERNAADNTELAHPQRSRAAKNSSGAAARAFETGVYQPATRALAAARTRKNQEHLASGAFAARRFSLASQLHSTKQESGGNEHASTTSYPATAGGAAASQAAGLRRFGHPTSHGVAAAALAATPTPTPTSVLAIAIANSRPVPAEPGTLFSPADAQAGEIKPSPAATESTAQAVAPPAALAADANQANRPASRVVTLELPVLARPEEQPMADIAPLRPGPVTRRWAAALLAGPALTHRQLEPAGASAAPSSGPYGMNPTTADLLRTAEMVQRERPSVGFGVQAQVRRMLNGRWSLSTGLGYQEYASQASNGSAAAVAFVPAPTSKASHRDTYRFLTVPLRLGYGLGAAEHGLHLGLLAGAEAAVCLGSSTLATDGSVANWGSSGSPYRMLSVAFSTGLDVRYRLASRLELVGQPTATYFLTSLTKPASGLGSRYPWAVGALFGVSFDLR